QGRWLLDLLRAARQVGSDASLEKSDRGGALRIPATLGNFGDGPDRDSAEQPAGRRLPPSGGLLSLGFAAVLRKGRRPISQSRLAANKVGHRFRRHARQEVRRLLHASESLDARGPRKKVAGGYRSSCPLT